MAIREINLYDPDEVFKQKCNENFMNLSNRVDLRSIVSSIQDQLFPVGSVLYTTNKNDVRLQQGTWEYRGFESYQEHELADTIYMYRYERVS